MVFDEAHTIENVATDHLGANISNTNLKFLMDLLFNSKKQLGLLFTIGSQDAMEWVEINKFRFSCDARQVTDLWEVRET